MCNDRQALIQQGLDPVDFAYPFGAYNAAVEAVVQSCGYTTGRAAGGMTSPAPAQDRLYSDATPTQSPCALLTE